MDEGSIGDFLPRLTYELMKAGATQSTINSFRAHWNILAPGSEKLPCPICYASGRLGWLSTSKKNDPVIAVLCDRCNVEIVVHRIN